MHIGEATLNPIVVIAQPLVINAEEMQHRGVEIMPGYRLLDRLVADVVGGPIGCLLYTSPSPRDLSTSRMPSSA